MIWTADGFAFLRRSSPTQCNTDRALNEDKHRTYRCAVVIVFAFLDWVTWQAFVSKDSKKSSSALADILDKGSTVKQWCVCTLNHQTTKHAIIDNLTQQHNRLRKHFSLIIKQSFTIYNSRQNLHSDDCRQEGYI